jgi:hypothetical protein
MKRRLRTQQLYIDLPTPDSEPWLNLIIQMVEMDDNYNTVNVVDRWGQVNARLSSIAWSTYLYTDPIPHEDGHISVVGIGDAITVLGVELIIQKYGGYLDERGLIMME